MFWSNLNLSDSVSDILHEPQVPFSTIDLGLITLVSNPLDHLLNLLYLVVVRLSLVDSDFSSSPTKPTAFERLTIATEFWAICCSIDVKRSVRALTARSISAFETLGSSSWQGFFERGLPVGVFGDESWSPDDVTKLKWLLVFILLHFANFARALVCSVWFIRINQSIKRKK